MFEEVITLSIDDTIASEGVEFGYKNCKLSNVINVLQNMVREPVYLQQRNHFTEYTTEF